MKIFALSSRIFVLRHRCADMGIYQGKSGPDAYSPLRPKCGCVNSVSFMFLIQHNYIIMLLETRQVCHACFITKFLGLNVGFTSQVS